MLWRCHVIPCVHFYFFFRIHCKVHWQKHFEGQDTLQLKILRTWIKISANSFIHQDLSKHHKEKINEYTFKIITCKKYKPALQRTFHQSKWYLLIVMCFFFSQANLVFKYNPVFIDILGRFCHSLFTFLLFDCWYSTKFEFHPVPLRVFK